MPKVNDYFSAASYITPRLKPELKDFFDATVSSSIGLAIQSDMSEWLLEASKSPDFDKESSFKNYIWYILSTENETSSKIPLRKFTESRRKRRNYFVTTIKQEKKSGFTEGLLRNNCDTYFQLLPSNSEDIKRYSSKEEYLTSKYNQIIAWGSSKANDLITFPFIYQIPAWRAVKCFYNDCAYNIYSLVDESFGGDVLRGYVKTIYKDINGPVWSLNPREEDVSFDVRSNEINSFLEKSYTSTDGTIEQIKTVVSQYKGNGSDEFIDYINNGSEQTLVDNLIKSGILSPRANVLDSTDKVLCGNIYSSFSVEDINRGAKSIRLLSLVKQMYGANTKPRREYYEKIIERLDKMAHCTLDMVTTNSQGKFVKGGTISFFEVTYQIPQNEEVEDGLLYTSYSVNNSSSHEHLKEALRTCNELSDISVEIAPSKYFKDMLRNDMNYNILTEIYNAEMPVKVKSMLMVLFRERSDIYPQTSCTFSYDFFIYNLGIEPMKKSLLTKQLDSLLRYLKDHKIVVSDYKLTAYTVEIKYIPVNDEEKYWYNLQPKALAGES